MRALVFALSVMASTTALAQARPRQRTTSDVQAAPVPAGDPASKAGVSTKAEPKERVVYRKRTVIDFTGALIEGDLMKPEGSYVVSRKASRFSSLIRVRENFLPELIASPNDL